MFKLTLSSVFLLLLVDFSTTFPKHTKLQFRNIYKEPLTKIDVKPNPKIIGGQEAIPHEFPYQAFLEIYSTDAGWYCGGALISKDYVLTAGHCGFGAANAFIILGAHSPLDEDEYHFKTISDSIIVHELYANENIANDIAVIKLSVSAQLSTYIQTISLPWSNIDYTGYVGTSTGWGVTQAHDMTPSDVLNFIELTIIDNDVCGTYFGNLSSSEVCAQDDIYGGNLCDGDAGGPLVADDVLVGIASFGAPYCLAGYPTVFTKISKYLDWIQDNTNSKI